jgi:type IV secretion system protein VirB9
LGGGRAGRAAVALVLLCALAAAGEPMGLGGGSPSGRPPIDQLLYSSREEPLTPKEQEILKRLEPWKKAEVAKAGPVAAPDGAVEYTFGLEMPSLVCAVQNVTDVEFQAGEELTGVNIGDSVRWKIEPVMSGDDTPHLILKPLDVGLETSMVVTTTRRTYHFRLTSHYSEFMPWVRFAYTEDVLAKWERIQSRRKDDYERGTIPETREYLGDLSFEYTITGSARWKPTRVYHDERKTVIEMPFAMRQTEAPTLLVVRRGGRILKKSEQTIVNYRIQGSRYIVDAIFDRAVMIVGVGGNQERITIVRNEKKEAGN